MTERARPEEADPPRRAQTFPLRLPASLRAAVDRLAKDEGTSVNQLIAIAVAEKVSALATEEEFTRRAGRADLKAFDRIMGRETGEAEEGDRMMEQE